MIEALNELERLKLIRREPNPPRVTRYTIQVRNRPPAGLSIGSHEVERTQDRHRVHPTVQEADGTVQELDPMVQEPDGDRPGAGHERSSERSSERSKGTETPDGPAHSAVPPRAKIRGAVNTRIPGILAGEARMAGFDGGAAAWTLALLDAPGEFGELDAEDREEVLADALRDLTRKGVDRWNPVVFLPFLVAACTPGRMQSTDDEREKATPELGARLLLPPDAAAPETWRELAAALSNRHSRARE